MKTRRLIYVALLLVLGGMALQWGYLSGFRDAGLPNQESFFPAWAVTSRFNKHLWVQDTDSALGRLNRRPKPLTLKDLARMHGHLCDGLVVSWVELSAVLHELFPQGIVDRTDLRLVSRNGPCWVDAGAWTTGARINHGTLVLDNTVGDGFIVQRISTGKAVHVRLRPGVFPAELADLEWSIRNRRATAESVDPQEIDRFETLAEEFSRWLLNTPPERLIELEPLGNFAFPEGSADLVAPRGDIINRDLDRGSHEKESRKR